MITSLATSQNWGKKKIALKQCLSPDQYLFWVQNFAKMQKNIGHIIVSQYSHLFLKFLPNFERKELF
jgi:hypothetical protein